MGKLHNEGHNTEASRCRDCGTDLEPGEGIVFSWWGYPWDGSDTEGSIMQELDRYTVCVHHTHCAERIVAQGRNVAALLEVAADYENLGDLALKARAILDDWATLGRQQAEAAGAAARETGYGAIGSGRHQTGDLSSQ